MRGGFITFTGCCFLWIEIALSFIPHSSPPACRNLRLKQTLRSADSQAAQFKKSYLKDVAKRIEAQPLRPLPDDIVIPPYEGPSSSFAMMEAGCAIEDLGLEILVGPSTISGCGRGLFISLQEDVEEVTLPRSTPICGYSRGSFCSQGEGDKTVAYSFSSLNTGVIYNKKVMSLREAVNSVVESTPELRTVIEGHELFIHPETSDIEIIPSEDYENRYFLPEISAEWNPSRYGMFANNLAYSPTCASREEYLKTSQMKNILQIIWRLEFDVNKSKFVPTWPVVILAKDVKFANRDAPMEVGIQYSWRYWEAARALSI